MAFFVVVSIAFDHVSLGFVRLFWSRCNNCYSYGEAQWQQDNDQGLFCSNITSATCHSCPKESKKKNPEHTIWYGTIFMYLSVIIYNIYNNVSAKLLTASLTCSNALNGSSTMQKGMQGIKAKLRHFSPELKRFCHEFANICSLFVHVVSIFKVSTSVVVRALNTVT